MERDSVPEEIDNVQRRLTQLELAARQLADENDEDVKSRLEAVRAEMEEQAAENWRVCANNGNRKNSA